MNSTLSNFLRICDEQMQATEHLAFSNTQRHCEHLYWCDAYAECSLDGHTTMNPTAILIQNALLEATRMVQAYHDDMHDHDEWYERTWRQNGRLTEEERQWPDGDQNTTDKGDKWLYRKNPFPNFLLTSFRRALNCGNLNYPKQPNHLTFTTFLRTEFVRIWKKEDDKFLQRNGSRPAFHPFGQNVELSAEYFITDYFPRRMKHFTGAPHRCLTTVFPAGLTLAERRRHQGEAATEYWGKYILLRLQGEQGFDKATVADLKKYCKENKMKGYSKMKKAQLITFILKYEFD